MNLFGLFFLLRKTLDLFELEALAANANFPLPKKKLTGGVIF